MYNLPYFKENDPAVIREFMRRNPFVLLCGCDQDNKPVATQIPVLIEEREEKIFLIGHVQRKTDHQLAFAKNPNVLAIFTGAHTYVSASWYTDPQTASTWNYMAVHAAGTLRFLDDAALLETLKRTTAHFENNKESPALVEHMSQDYVQKMMKGIISFEIEITRLENVFKLSQNRDEKTYDHIVDRLQEGDDGSAQVAAEMKERTSQLFDGGDEKKV
jgi:transcriptional regulator